MKEDNPKQKIHAFRQYCLARMPDSPEAWEAVIKWCAKFMKKYPPEYDRLVHELIADLLQHHDHYFTAEEVEAMIEAGWNISVKYKDVEEEVKP